MKSESAFCSFWIAAFLLLALIAAAEKVIIANNIPRRDTSGTIMDAHDGKIIGPFPHLGGLYLWYAASYGNCTEPAGDSGCSDAGAGNCGFQLNHNVSLWSSLNLKDWTPHGPVFQAAHSGLPDPIMFCPKVLFNRKNHKWVLWFNMILGADFSVSYYGVATAANFTGPFVLASRNVTTLAFSDVGDFNLFQDEDERAYVIYTAHIVSNSGPTHQMSVEELTEDYLESKGSSFNSGFFGQSFVEAPAMFKRNNVYYAVFGACCCYCEAGSPVSVYAALSALGPYSLQSGGPIDEPHRLTTRRKANRRIHAQQTDIASYMDRNKTKQFLWIGDRWQQAPDRVKGHDPTYWGPLHFSASKNGSGVETVDYMAFLDNFTIDI
jgi:hypothetical protein